MADGDTDPLEALKTDLEGLYAAHVHAHGDFSGSRFTALLAVYALPLVVLGTLASAGVGIAPDFARPLSFPLAVNFVFLLISVLGICVLRMWIASYLLGQWYARGINDLRGVYVPLLKAKHGAVAEWKPWLPTTTAGPKWTAGRFVMIIASAFSGVSGFYAALAILSIATSGSAPGCAYLMILAIVAASAVAGYVQCRSILRSALPGADPA